MPRINTKMVNAAIEKLGGKERLVHGKGYFYFTGGDSELWPRSSVMIYRLNSMTLEQWVEEYKQLKAAYEANT
jgi:hypothetical protein